VSGTTLKSEISHLRQLLGGAIDSRPYRLTLTVDADVVDALAALRVGDTKVPCVSTTDSCCRRARAPSSPSYATTST